MIVEMAQEMDKSKMKGKHLPPARMWTTLPSLVNLSDEIYMISNKLYTHCHHLTNIWKYLWISSNIQELVKYEIL